MPVYKYANNPSTTLSGAATAGDTSISVTSGAAFPTTGRFTIVIESEIILVTGVAGTTWTVERGSEASAAVAHGAGATVTGVLTRASLFSSRGIDVRSFGALGDGATDDATAIQNALNAVDSAGGGEVFVPDGTHMVGTSLSVPANTVLRGTGAGSIIKLMGAVNGPVVTLAGSLSRVTELKIDGNRANQTGTSSGVVIDADDVTVDHNIISACLTHGIDATDQSKLRIQDNDVSDTGNTAIFVHCSAADITDVLVENNRVDRRAEGATLTEGGIKIRGVEGGASFALSHARVLGNQVYMPESPTTQPPICIELWGLVEHATVANNVTVGGSMGISFDHTVQSTATGNTCVGWKTVGMELAFSDLCTFSGNVVDGNNAGTKGIVLSNTAPQFNAVTGNIIRRCASRGIQTNTGTEYVTVSGNTIYHAASYAIDFIGTKYSSITGNTIYGSGTALKGIMLDHSYHTAVTGNLIRGFTEQSVYVFANTAVTLDWITIVANVLENGYATGLTGGAALGVNVEVSLNPN